VALDLDSAEIKVHGQQEQGAYNGHFASSCSHPPLLFNIWAVQNPDRDATFDFALSS
jgi:hypothetical protein